MERNPLNNEREILEKITEGDQSAFNILFDAYYNLLGEYVFKVTKSLVLSEEIVQDTFIKIWIKRNKLNEINNFRSYLFMMCRNQTIDYLRKIAKDKIQIAALDRYLIESSKLDIEEGESDIYRTAIDKAINKLPPQAQKVYLLSRHERLKHDEIAKKLNISVETVKKHIQHAVNFIKKDINSTMSLSILVIILDNLLKNNF